GQGVVTETLQLSKLEGYQVGGTVHIISNNQIGFTTNPQDSRSTTYSSDTSKCIKAPVLLVNGDDVEACVRAMDIALRFRQEFAQDIVIDLICYRRYGHNEGDEPAFTQPKMYKKIKKHPTPMKIYSDELVKQGFSEEKLQSFYQQKIDNLQGILEEVRKNSPQQELDALGGLWTGLKHGTKEDLEKPVHTNVSGEKLLAMGEILSAEPADFKLNKKVQRLLAQRKKMIEDNAIDWGLGELLAYATLCSEGTPVRLSGQDCKRGTFTHRHAIYFDQETDREFSPLNTINYPEGEFCVYNSSLSELAVLGFEYGNASSDPTYLTIWEAQFGDFANGAQIMIDQFISSGETKWARMSGLTMLLPHGYEGQGPEHSSARLERYLQLCAQENMQVCNLTTPANLFHVLRRQVKRDFRKPLIIMSPKSLLRHPKVVSPLTDFTEGHFKEVIEDHTITQPENVETVILCSGKVFYDIEKAREEEKPNSQKVALVRLEQIYPLVHSQLAPQLNGYKNLKHIIWLQEEPKNMGAYSHVAPKIQEFLFELGIKKIPVQYVGRPEKASPATGSPKAHSDEQKAIIAECLKYM
ncbi:MAG: 2-oxoglutarate dehydrogenase E1 component, partial [Bdellovibrionales bacterium]|nr:2-oxoglutarate dehydrogenase E1 component [Bdellovibrionales bacterium]